MSRYADLQALQRYLGFGAAEGTADEALLQECLDRAEAAIDAYTRRSFVGTPGTVYANRFEQGRVVDSAFYLQEDLHTLVSLTLGDGREVPVGSVWLEPREGPPYRILRLKSQYVYTWNTDQDMIIAGTFGFGTVPPYDVTQAAIRWAATLYREKDRATTDMIGNEALGQSSIPSGMPRDVMYLLLPYRSRTGGVV